MKSEHSFPAATTREEPLAQFGRVQLIRRGNGRHELAGGSRSEQISTRAWCESFAPFVNFGAGREADAPQDINDDKGFRLRQIQSERLGFEAPFLQACEALWILTSPCG